MTIQSLSNIFSCAHRLIPGNTNQEHLRLLIDISTIRSDKIINALNDYFVLGESRANVCEKYNVNQGYLSLKIRELQGLSAQVYNLFPYYA
ncbi:PapB/FocB family fimbrial expression transcriptional regulator [Providencia rustigianii]|uniref:Major pilu subunit operon regulatory protein PapB n=3 Tax=Providencia rustigianii TaxID=158850 RepID=D1P761_9GAMM|nr:PapB/FocB family fimbrial expression transcriptional regulator [Providencia rustigianii]EFB70908.1 major pilu subunit operon regulatory protein PapB [Providencia rustigianii DSM 4541]SUC25520.1 Major pilu subunit operon regulatory protein papB [Providencia rustigianii]